jgi:hypothetical protein
VARVLEIEGMLQYGDDAALRQRVLYRLYRTTFAGFRLKGVMAALSRTDDQGCEGVQQPAASSASMMATGRA